MTYLDKLTQRAAHLKPGIYRTTVAHDADCPRLLGVGPCSCNPDISTTRMNRAQRRAKSRRRS